MIDLVWFQLLSAALFVIGLYGVMARRSAVLIIMSIELMLNAVNINLIAAACSRAMWCTQRWRYWFLSLP